MRWGGGTGGAPPAPRGGGHSLAGFTLALTSFKLALTSIKLALG